MKKKRHSPEQIIRKLREADGMLSAGRKIAEICQKREVSEQTFRLAAVARFFSICSCRGDLLAESQHLLVGRLGRAIQVQKTVLIRRIR